MQLSKQAGKGQDHECSACNVAAADNVINDFDQIFSGTRFWLSVRSGADASGRVIAGVL